MHGGSLGSSKRQLDIRNESDVLTLLQIVRGSALDTTSKDEIRDLVFSLRGTFDEATLQTLAVHTAPLNVTLLGVDEPAASQPKMTPEAVAQPIVSTTSGFPVGRPTPRFAPSTTAPAPATNPSTTLPTETTPTPVPDTKQPSTSSPQPTEQPAAPVTPPSAETTPASTEAAADKSAQPEPAPQPAAPSAPVTEPAATPTPVQNTQTSSDPKQRIAEIKQAINAKGGNPVNLIDATNEVGREYMNALLEAMKATQGGGDSTTAMARLETAYTAVISALANTEATPQTAPKETSTTPTTPATPTPAAAPAADTPAPTPVAATATPVAAPPAPPKDTPAKNPAPAAAPAPATPTPPAPPQAPDTAAARSPLTSVAASDFKTVDDRMPEVEEAPAPTDSLMSEAVTEGLKQLLNEWKLFKSGGILGTGPKGIDHPLYKELQNNPMNLIIAGRFEGATPEVKQSIHDYMNGWRYEQGMTHDLKETFEHYLRRVVKTIIDKQAKSQ